MLSTPCQATPDLFFPSAAQHAKRQRAQAMCATCPMIEACHRAAVDTNQQHGVWGGVDFGNPTRRTPDRETATIILDENSRPVGIEASRFSATHCRSGGHEFTPDNTAWGFSGDDLVRKCRICLRGRKKTQKARARARKRNLLDA